MKNDEFEGTITYIHNAKRNINQTLSEAIQTMSETELRDFLLRYMDDKMAYENEVIKAIYETKNLGLATNIAGLTQAHAQNLNNNIISIVSPQKEINNDLSSMFK